MTHHARYVCTLAAALLALVLCACGESNPAANDPSFYMREVRKSGLDVEGMRPCLISPLASDALHPDCPPEVVLETDDDSYGHLVAPYVKALGPLVLEAKPQEGLATEVATQLERVWDEMRNATQEAPGEQPLRVMVNHYQRRGDPGRCVTIRATFYTVPDPAFDLKLKPVGTSLPGALCMFWKTYQLEAPEPVLIEWGVEVTTQTKVFGWRKDFATLADLPELPQGWLRDELAGGHFFGYGGGRRAGLTWIDRGAGTKPADPWSGVYTIDHVDETAEPIVQTAPLPTPWIKGLRALIERL